MKNSTKLSIQSNGNTTTSGNLDVGSGSSSRIRSHASVSGYTGYSELNTASPWDMFLNPNTTYPNGGWMYSKLIMSTICNYQVVVTKWTFIKKYIKWKFRCWNNTSTDIN